MELPESQFGTQIDQLRRRQHKKAQSRIKYCYYLLHYEKQEGQLFYATLGKCRHHPCHDKTVLYYHETHFHHPNSDLATRNVLVKEREWIQITDFGLAKMLSGDEEESGEVIVQSGRVPIRWLAIETLTSGRYSFKTDIWAYGKPNWSVILDQHSTYLLC